MIGLVKAVGKWLNQEVFILSQTFFSYGNEEKDGVGNYPVLILLESRSDVFFGVQKMRPVDFPIEIKVFFCRAFQFWKLMIQ